jgi:HK97 gp10 family phage protein
MAASVKVTDNTRGAIKGSIQGAERTVIEACIRVQSQAKALAPVKSGQLRSSVGYKTTNASDGELSVSPNKYEGYVGSNVDYAVYQEFGTRKMAPQPFLRPAIGILNGSGAKTAISKILQKNMDEYTKRVSK